MLRELASEVGEQRLDGGDFIDGEDEPVLIGRRHVDEGLLNRDVLRVEDVVNVAVDESDTERFEGLAVD